MVIGDKLVETAEKFAEKEALVYEDERLTWAEYRRRVDIVAARLLALGIKKGDRVAVWATNRPEYLYTYLAAARIGAVLVGINPQYTVREALEVAMKSRPVLAVVMSELLAVAEPAQLRAMLPFVRHLFVIGLEEPVEGAQPYSDLLEEVGGETAVHLEAQCAAVQPDDPALIVYTGGSTGLPMGAVLTHRNILTTIGREVDHLGLLSSDRLLLLLPLNHVSGGTVLAIPPLLSGATLIVMERFSPSRTLELVAAERITLWGQVPTMFIMELGLPDFEDYDLSSLRKIVVAGAPTPLATMNRLAELGPPPVHGYGLSEVAGFVTFTSVDDHIDTIRRTVGRPVPGVEIKIVDNDRQPLPVGEIGEVALRGDCVMAGYDGEPEETAAAIDEAGWFYTGDYGSLDKLGNLTIAGLKKEMFFTGGYNVYPREIEDYVGGHPDVTLVACIGIPHDVLGQVGALFVQLRDGAHLSVGELKRFCKVGLARYKVPRLIQFVDHMPVTPAGKLDKKQLYHFLQVAAHPV